MRLRLDGMARGFRVLVTEKLALELVAQFADATPKTSSRRLMVLAMNAGPLSERMKAAGSFDGTGMQEERVLTTSSAVIERSTSMVRHYLVYLSTMGIIFSLRLSSVRSIPKS
jgi:hypothetical protein